MITASDIDDTEHRVCLWYTYFAAELTVKSVDSSSIPSLVGSVVFTVQARDDDRTAPFNTITYSIIGDEGVAGVFAINPCTGQITLISSLATANQNEFRVCVHISDFHCQ